MRNPVQDQYRRIQRTTWADAPVQVVEQQDDAKQPAPCPNNAWTGQPSRSTICKLEAKRQRTNEFPGPTCEQLCTSTNHLNLQICEMLSLRGLLCVISGLLAGGIPGFRTVLCYFFSQILYGESFRCVSLFPFCLVALATPILVDAKSFSFAVCCMVLCHLQFLPFFVFGCCSFCLFGFWFVLLCFLFGRFFWFIAL